MERSDFDIPRLVMSAVAGFSSFEKRWVQCPKADSKVVEQDVAIWQGRKMFIVLVLFECME